MASVKLWVRSESVSDFPAPVAAIQSDLNPFSDSNQGEPATDEHGERPWKMSMYASMTSWMTAKFWGYLVPSMGFLMAMVANILQVASFVSNNLPKLILEDADFPRGIEKVIAAAFLQTDSAFAEACSLDATLASGTAALTAAIVGRSLVVANAEDCRAVLCRRGKAIEMSRDHKPGSMREMRHVEASGGYVSDGYLNGQLNVARALGDWHMGGLKTPANGGRPNLGPLSREPEMMRVNLTESDEFLVIGCDGIWDVFRSQNAVGFARRKLQQHNDPLTCCKELINEALKHNSSDNLAVVVVFFQSKHLQPVSRSNKSRGAILSDVGGDADS